MKQNDFQKVANQVSFVTIVVNILLAFMKLLAGVFAHSNAMISDSIHSASDCFCSLKEIKCSCIISQSVYP